MHVARLVCGDHILNINEGVRSPVALKRLKSLRDKIPDILTTLLAVIDVIACPYHWNLDL